MTGWDVVGTNDVASRHATASASHSDAHSVQQTMLCQRLAGAAPADRADLLYDAMVGGVALNLPGADLRRIDLRRGRPVRGPDLCGPDVQPAPVVLDGANLEGAMLSGACLFGVSLRGARLDGALLVGCDLSGADLAGASLRSANLTGANLSGAGMSYADLRGASLLTCDLSGASAVGIDLRDALLQSAVLDRTVLLSGDLRWARLTGASLRGADARDARFEGASLALSDFRDVRLSPATDFGMAFLYGARFADTELTREHLRGVVGEEITNRAIARDTYLELSRVFADLGHDSDARWARRRAARMDAATHRPGAAARYYPPRTSSSPLERAAFHARHTARWLWGPMREILECLRWTARD